MLEPKYDEDTVNLGYLKKVISDTEEGIDNTYKNVSRHYASRPQPPYYKGDTWIDGDIVYTCINTRTIGLYQDSDWVTESGAKVEAERKNKTYISQPSNYNPGDMWILQTDEDHRAGKKGEILISTAGRKEYDADDWVNMLGYGSIKSINEVAGNLNNAINRIGNVEEAIQDGLIITFYQDTVPEGKHLGDLWYVTGEVEGYIQGKIYRYDGTNWIILNDPTIQEAFDEANEARLVADGKIQSFYSVAEPTQNVGVGDLWIDLSNNNQLYRYNGTNWVAVYDTRINELVTTVETVTERVVTIETDLGEIDLKVQENTTSITNIEGNVEDMQDNIVSLQAQIDGAIQFWNGSDIPTVENYPANEWVTEADKNNHRADIYTVIEDVDGELKQGKSYRFDKVGDTWQWIELTDNELSAVQALATSKAKVFVTNPTVPYSVGDLWLNNGKLYRCKTAKDSNGIYSLADWEIAVNYTDDTVAELAKTLANNAQNTADSAVEGVNNITNTQGEAEGKNIHIKDSAEEPFVDVELYGESTQNGTPTPDNPINIENIEGRNKFNVNGNLEQITGVHTTVSNNQIHIPNSEGNSHSALFDYIEVEPNKDINISFDLVQGTARMGLRLYDKDKNIIDSSNVSLPNFTYNAYYKGYLYQGNNISTTIPENVKYIRYLTIAMRGTEENIYENLQIEKGNKRTPYVPYNSLEVKVEGKNRFKPDIVGWISVDGTINTQQLLHARITERILCKEGEIFSLSWEANNPDTNIGVICFFDSTGNRLERTVETTKTQMTAIAPSETSYVMASVYDNTTMTNFQFEKDEPTYYEPYKSQTAYFPLTEGQKLMEGSYLADDGVHNRRGQKVFDGTEINFTNSSSPSQETVIKFNFPLPLSASSQGENSLKCNLLQEKPSWRIEEECIDCFTAGKGLVFSILRSRLQTEDIAGFKMWLSANPIIVEYELAEPEVVPYTEEQQEAWNKIKALMTYKNITNITSDAYAKVVYMRDNGLDVYETKQSAKVVKEQLAEQKITVDGILDRVSRIEDLTQTTSGTRTIVLSNCAKGDLLSLWIKGNNEVFEYLYPSDTLYPSYTLYPIGDSRIVVIDKDNNEVVYELGVTDVLRQNGEVYDEFILENGQAKVIRRINEDGTVKATEITEDLGKLSIPLNEGINTIKIKNYSAEIGAKYVVKSDYTEAFATRLEMNSSIEQTAEGINQEVRKKVDENEVISKINQTAEEVSIDANRININGAVSANGNFKIDTERKYGM